MTNHNWLEQFRNIAERWDASGIARQTSPEEMAIIAAAIESSPTNYVLECGASTGFSSACLSHACKGRAILRVTDTFAGIPRAEEGYAVGAFACSYGTWLANYLEYGSKDMAEPYHGLFGETLVGWCDPFGVLWLDVDLQSSVDEALGNVLSYLEPDNGLIFSHETEPGYFTDAGKVDRGACNGVWRAIDGALSTAGLKYRAEFLTGCLGVVRLQGKQT